MSTEPPGGGWEHVQESLILVCTNGRHDQCCANLGRPLVRALRDSPWADRVWECSHIGGDRFAANVVVLPDSLYFGRVEPDVSPGAAGRARRRSNRPLPVPWAHLVLARRAGGRALRAARARHRGGRRCGDRPRKRPTGRSPCVSPIAWCTFGCGVGSCRSPSRSRARADPISSSRRSRSNRSPDVCVTDIGDPRRLR